MFNLTLGELVGVSLMVVIIFGGMVGAVLVFGALMLLMLSYVPHR